MRKIVFYFPILLIIVLSIFFYYSLGIENTKIESPLIGKDVPKFSLKQLDNNNYFTNKDLENDDYIKFINVWASWCIPCRAEHEALKIIANIDNVEIYGINYKDNEQEALNFINELGNPYKKIGVDNTGRTSIEWGVFGVPETYIVFAGKVIYKHIGPIHLSELESKILPILKTLK